MTGACIFVYVVQCDQMARLFVQFLAIQDNENFPIDKKYAKEVSKFCPIPNKHSNKCPKTLTMLPEWRNFGKSGHTVYVCTWDTKRGPDREGVTCKWLY